MNFWISLPKKTKIIISLISLIILGVGIYLILVPTEKYLNQETIYRRGDPVILSGSQTYEFIQNQIVSPRIKFLTVNPLDAKIGETQKFTAIVAGEFEVSSASLELEDDSGIEELELKKQVNEDLPVSRYSVDVDNNLILSGNSESSSSSISYWSGERIIKKEYKQKYSITVKAKELVPASKDRVIGSETRELRVSFERLGRVILDWKAVCTTPFGGDWDLSDSCIVSYTDGVDDGNVHARNYSTMVLDADFGLNQGKSIIFQPLGVVAVNAGAQIKRGNIWKVRDDVAGTKEVVSEKSPGYKYERRYQFMTVDGDPEVGNKSSFYLPPGKQIFQVSSGESTGPKIIQATIDPLDVKVGDTQNLSLIVQSGTPLLSVTAKIETDNGIIDLPLALEGKTSASELLPERFRVIKGELVFVDDVGKNKNISAGGIPTANAAFDSGNLTYKGSWVVKDTHTAQYHTSFVVRDISGSENSVLMAWSDPCSTFTAGNRSLNTCSFSDIDGADNGNLTINTNQTVTMLSGATMVFNSGRSLIISGTIVVSNTAQIVKTNLWRTDADGDSWAANASFVAQASQPAGKVRAYSAPNSSDCYDFNSQAYPGYSGYWVDTDRGDGSFDYNCDGWESPEITNSVDVGCDYNGTVYPTCSNPSGIGWCNVIDYGPGGTNYPYCAGYAGVPSCGASADFYYAGGCDQSLYGGVNYTLRTMGCK